MLPIEATQRKSEASDSFQVTYQYAWASHGESNHEGQTYADCNQSTSYNVSLFNLTIACNVGGENQ